MGTKQMSHAVYDTSYHLLGAPKYGERILREGTKCGKGDVSRDPGSKGLGGAGDTVTSDTIKQYLQYHRHEEKTPTQLRFDF